MRFQSTHPVRGATYNAMQTADKVDISIHAPREGCDGLAAYAAQGDYQFQSTHPVRGATDERYLELTLFELQSTHPVRGATEYGAGGVGLFDISIHAPREGCD